MWRVFGHATVVAMHSLIVRCTKAGYDLEMRAPETRNFQMTDMTVVQDKMKAIATAHADYAKSSFGANKAYLEKLGTIKAPDEAMQITTDHMKSAYETFVAEATKIGDMYKDFFKSAFEPMTVGTPKLTVVN
jgi:hypothetical protein